MSITSREGGVLLRKTAEGSSTIGSWGVILQVDRKKMLTGEGFWEVDNSMLGVAVTRALKSILR